jgi:S-formylglutathione hydrolase FrmB
LGVGVGVLGGCSGPPADGQAGAAVRLEEPSQSSSTSSTSSAPVDPVSIEQLHSIARGTHVELIVIRPAGVGGRLPACLALHGRGANARVYLDLGVPEMLSTAVAAGMSPFAVVAVDGGDSYWVARDAADDPQKMLRDELPGWLDNRGLVSTPFAGFGISMGAYGVLNYARRGGLAAVAAVSPALFTSWPDARSRDAFASNERWEATEPLRHVDEIEPIPLGVWCGTADPFIDAAQQLVDTSSPDIAVIGAGGHDAEYWKRVLPDVLWFAARHMS